MTDDTAREALAAALYRLEWRADLYATPRGGYTERYERRADRLLASPAMDAVVAERVAALAEDEALITRLYRESRGSRSLGDIRMVLRALAAACEHQDAQPEKWIAFPGRAAVCQDCGADWVPVWRGECQRCGSDAGPLRSASTGEGAALARQVARMRRAQGVSLTGEGDRG